MVLLHQLKERETLATDRFEGAMEEGNAGAQSLTSQRREIVSRGVNSFMCDEDEMGVNGESRINRHQIRLREVLTKIDDLLLSD